MMQSKRNLDMKPHMSQVDPGDKDYTLYGLQIDGQMSELLAANVSYRYQLTAESVVAFGVGVPIELWNVLGALDRLQSATVGTELMIGNLNGSQPWPESGPVPGFPDTGATIRAAAVSATLQRAAWTRISGCPSDAFVRSTTDGSNNFAISFSSLQCTETEWSGAIVWYAIAPSDSGPSDYLIHPEEIVALSYQTEEFPAPARDYSWYSTSVAVLLTQELAA
jgi:hypothetical protein